MHENYNYWRPNPEFIAELLERLRGCKVLEIFAGNGYLASLLNEGGIHIISTTRFASHDGHDIRMYYPVIEMKASEAVKKYGEQSDILLMSWPTVTEEAIRAVRLWGTKPFLFIGEITNYPRNELGGCATDSFFEETFFYQEFKTYRGNYIEKAVMGRLRK
jgi:hypothetical protein